MCWLTTNQTVAYRPSCAPNDLQNTQLKFCQILAVHILCYTIDRETDGVSVQTGGVTTNLPHVRAAEDKSIRDAAVAYPDAHSFHRAVAPIVVLGQCFGLLPVHGLTSSSTQGLRCVGILVLSGEPNENLTYLLTYCMEQSPS